MYLYAWPAEKLIAWWFPQVPLILLGVLTALVAYFAGWLSWTILEQPILKAVHKRKRRRSNVYAEVTS